jgi:hypothetical protein
VYANVHVGSFQVDGLQPAVTGEGSTTSLLPASSFGSWGDLSSAPRTPAPRVDLTRLALGTILLGDTVARTGRSERSVEARYGCGGMKGGPCSNDIVYQHAPGRNGANNPKSR